MTLYVLDTDHLSLLRRGNETQVKRVSSIPPTRIAITIITIEEQFRAWFTQVRKARDLTRLSRAYAGLYDVIEMSRNLSVLPFSPEAVELAVTTFNNWK